MHVEFRCCYVDSACTFSPQSFYRVKEELLRKSKTEKVATKLPPLSLYDLEGTNKKSSTYSHSTEQLNRDEQWYTPKFQVEFVLDHVFRFSTLPVDAEKSNSFRYSSKSKKCDSMTGTGACVMTSLFSASFWEALIAPLPLKAINAVVKIRLLQLSPPLRTECAKRAVQQALKDAITEEHKENSPLCIGVGKITLLELLSSCKGMRIALQAKKGLVKAVEELNLCSTSVNSLFGERLGGSAFLVFDVSGIRHSRDFVPAVSKLSTVELMYDKAKSEIDLGIENAGKRGDTLYQFQNGSHIGNEISPNESFGERNFEAGGGASYFSKKGFGDTIYRPLVAPYVATVAALLSVNDLLLWNRWSKTLLFVCMCFLAFVTSMLPVFLSLCVFYGLWCYHTFLTKINKQLFPSSSSLLYSPTYLLENRGNDSFSAAVADRDENIPLRRKQVRSSISQKQWSEEPLYLYGRQNVLLNVFVRILYFSRLGASENSFYELNFLFFLLGKMKWKIFSAIAAVCILLVVLPFAFFLITLCIFGFAIYPIMVRFTIPRSEKNRKRCLSSLKYLRNTWYLNRPLSLVFPSVSAESGGNDFEKNSEEREANPLFQCSPADHNVRPNYNSSVASTSRFSSSPHNLRQPGVYNAKQAFALLSFTWMPSKKSTEPRLRELLLAHNKKLKDLNVLSSAPQLNRGRSQTFSSVTYSSFGKTAASPSRHSGTPSETRSGFESSKYVEYLETTYQLLLYLRHEVRIIVHVSTTTNVAVMPESRCSLDSLIQPMWLQAKGEDDAITSAFMGSTATSFAVGRLGKRSAADAKPEVRALAALAAYLLQGARLSIYSRGTSNRNCYTILPLVMGSSGLERYHFPCLEPFQIYLYQTINTLEGIWKDVGADVRFVSSRAPFSTANDQRTGGKSDIVNPAAALEISEELVLHLVGCTISAIKDSVEKIPETKKSLLGKIKEEKVEQPNFCTPVVQ